MSAAPARRTLPDGIGVRLLPGTWRGEGGRALFGGAPTRMLFLKPAACALLGDGEVTVHDPRSAGLARLLLDRGFAQVVPAARRWGPCDVTVVVPVKDRPAQLERLLAALDGLRTVVVDDGSADAGATLEVARARGAAVLFHPTCRGPAAARNTGLAAVRTPLVAFVDSDVVPARGWLGPLLDQLEDPAVGIAAPRIGALPEPGRAGAVERYERVRSSLDLGAVPAVVRPRGTVPYVPSACLVGRVEAFGDGFDERMHVGEDVDLVWRTGAAGWLVRYVPESRVAHDHRVDPGRWLARKAFYGTSAAPLAQRHGDAVAPVVAGPLTVAVGLALLVQRPWAVGTAAGVTGAVLWGTARDLEQSSRPWVVASRLAPYGVAAAFGQCSAALSRHWWPAVLPAAVVSRRVRRAWLATAVADGFADWVRTRPALDPLTYTVLRRADDAAYGAGLWWGAIRAATTAPLRPALSPGVGALLSRAVAPRAGAVGPRWPGTWRRGTGTHRR